jgi:hypothetical protein
MKQPGFFGCFIIRPVSNSKSGVPKQGSFLLFFLAEPLMPRKQQSVPLLSGRGVWQLTSGVDSRPRSFFAYPVFLKTFYLVRETIGLLPADLLNFLC